MKKRWVYVLVGVFVLSLVLAAQSAPREVVQAQTEYRAFFPMIREPVRTGFDDFEDEDPEWIVTNRAEIPENKDGFFMHRDGRLLGAIRDNAARLIASPAWSPMGDFKLEVKARFEYTSKQSLNGLGLVFNGNSDWSKYFAFMLAYGGDQHFWTIVRLRDYKSYYLDQDVYIGAPNFVRDYDGWNHLMVIKRGETIYLYCNGHQLRDQPEEYSDPHYLGNPLVGVTITSYEMNDQDIEFDNFRLTSLD